MASVTHGIEWVAAGELSSSIDATEVHGEHRRIYFETTGAVDRLEGLRTIDDVFLLVGTVEGYKSPDELTALTAAVYQFDWFGALEQILRLRDIPTNFDFDVVTSVECKSRLSRFDIESAVGETISKIVGLNFLERSPSGLADGNSRLTVRVMFEKTKTTFAVRLAEKPLHRRTYKTSTRKGTLHPPVAAALSLLGAHDVDSILDPFCGDGTIAIEAKLFNQQLSITASDVDQARISNTLQNANNANVDVAVSCRDAATLSNADLSPIDAIVTNPPWKRVLEIEGQLSGSLEDFWKIALMMPKSSRLCVLTDTTMATPTTLSQLGWNIGLAQRLRVSGRVVDLVLAGHPEGSTPAIPEPFATWRKRFIDKKIVTSDGF